MKRTLVAGLIVLMTITRLAAQTPTLRGKVTSAENPPPRLWGGVKITVKNRVNNQPVPGEQSSTDDQDWFHVAPLGARVDVLFDKDCYVPEGLFDIGVGPGTGTMETVKLQRAKECLIADRRQTRIRYKRSASAQVSLLAGTFGIAMRGSIEATASSGPTSTADKAAVPADADLFPTPPALKRQLEKEAGLTREGGFFDTFQYNFSVKRAVYADVPALMEVLSHFRSDPQNQDLFGNVGEVRPEMFDDIVRAQFEFSAEVSLDHIKKVIKDEAISPSLRGSATVALLNLKFDSDTRNEIKEYFGQQDRNSNIFNTSLVARARLGDATLYEEIRNSKDTSLLIASMNAIATAEIIQGFSPLSEGSQTLAELANKSEDPIVRAYAFASLRPFAYRSDKTAIDTLIQGVQRDPDAAVRFRAAVSLGVGDLEDSGPVRRVLTVVARTDSSSDVRRAANFSLSGAKWMKSRR